MSEETNVQGNVTVTAEAPQAHAMSESPGIGKAAMEGIDNLGNMLIDALDWALSKTGGAALALTGLGAGVSAGNAGRYQDPGYDPQFAHAAPITLAKGQAIEAPGKGQAIALAVGNPYEAHEAELGAMVAPALPARTPSRGASLMRA